MTGILDDPGAAYAKLRELGQGLFGRSGIGRADKSGRIGETLDTLIQQGLGGRSRRSDSRRVAPCGPAFSGPSHKVPSQGKPPPLDEIMKQMFGR